eukprot:g10508.t1
MFFTSHRAVEMTNLHFIVHHDAALVLRAPALDFKLTDTEYPYWPLFTVDGELSLEATSPLPTRVEKSGSMTDKHGMISLGLDAELGSTWSIVYYAHNRISVGMPPEAQLTLHQQILKATMPNKNRPDFIDYSLLDHLANQVPLRTPTGSSDGHLRPFGTPAAGAGAFRSSHAAAPAADGAPGPGMSSGGGQQAGKTDQHRTFEIVTIRRCSDIPEVDPIFGGGIINILGGVVCRFPTVIELAGSTIIRSDKDIFTWNVLFSVHERVTVLFNAPTVTFSRSKKDKIGVVDAKRGGSVASASGTIRYSSKTIVAARPTAGNGSEEPWFAHQEARGFLHRREMDAALLERRVIRGGGGNVKRCGGSKGDGG